MSEFAKPAERVKNALDTRKLHLSTRCPADNTKWSSFTWLIVASNPRLVVWTNDPGDAGEVNNYGKIVANFDIMSFTVFLQLLGEVIDHSGERKESIETYNYIFPRGVRSETPVLVSTLYFGKDKDGIIWVSLVAKNRPVIKFVFGENEFHHYINGDGTPADKSKTSQRYARAYIKILYDVMEQLLVSTYVAPPPPENKQGGYKTTYNNNNTVEADLPF